MILDSRIEKYYVVRVERDSYDQVCNVKKNCVG